jgi:septum formation protein
MIEGEGVRLFKYIEGDYFSILGLPLIQILNFLDARGKIG